jgi:hypothetical protein
MVMKLLSEPLSLAAREELERIIQDDLQRATVSSAMVLVEEDGRIVINELVLQLDDGRIVTLMPLDVSPVAAVDLRLDIYDDHLPGGHGWREATVAEDYAEELEELTAAPWHPEPDTLEEARL